MDSILTNILEQYELFLLILVRVTGIFIISPFFSRTNIPPTMKVGFAFLVSLILLNTINSNTGAIESTNLVILIFLELSIGFIFGFMAYLFFTSLYLAGQIVDMKIGFSMVNVLDPQSNTQIPIMGNFYHILAILLFVQVNGHHVMIRALVDSYELLPVGRFILNEAALNQVISIMTQSFIIGFKISSPVLATIFLLDIFLGILARTMPQMNVFIVGMPLKITIGIITIILALPGLFIALHHIFTSVYEEIFTFLKVF